MKYKHLHDLIGYKNRFDFQGTHEEYYGKIVEALGYDEVVSCVPYSVEVLDEKMKEDRHFNNLPIRVWDLASGFRCVGADCFLVGSHLTALYRKHGVNCFSNSDGVCILKECAREMVMKYREEKIAV